MRKISMIPKTEALFRKIKTLVARNQWAWNVFRQGMKLLSWSLRPWTSRTFKNYLNQEEIKDKKLHSQKQEQESNSRFTILMVIGSLGPGGAERQLTMLANALITNSKKYFPGRELKIIIACLRCSSEPDNFFRNQLSEKIQVIDLSKYEIIGTEKKSEQILTRQWWFKSSGETLKKLLAVIEEKQPNVVHGWLDQIAVLSGLAAIRNRVPRVVLSTRNVNPSHFILDRPFFRTGLKILIRQKSVVVMNNSNVGARDYEKWLKIDSGSIKTVHNGFNLKKFENVLKKRLFLDDDVLIIGSVFRFSLEKNPQLWIKVASIVSKKIPQARFVIVGEGFLERKIHRWIKKYNLVDVIQIVGPTSTVYEIIAGFDIFLLTSTFEGLPNVLVEAQGLGVPVVSTNAGGAKETFMDKNSGHLINSTDAQEIAECLMQMLNNPALRASYGKKAQSWVKENFSEETMVNKHLNLYSLPDRG